MFERWTDRARDAVVRAQERARQWGRKQIDSDLVFLALLQHGGDATSWASMICQRLNITEELVLNLVGPVSNPTPTVGHIPFSAETKQAFEDAWREALSLGCNYVGTEHLLLGLLRRPAEPVGRILAQLQKDPADVAQAVKSELIKLQQDNQADEPRDDRMLADTRYTATDVMSILGRILAAAKQQLVLLLIEYSADVAVTAAAFVDAWYRALQVPNLVKAVCERHALDLSSLVDLLHRGNLVRSIDEDLAKAVNEFLQNCLAGYRRYVLDQSE